MARSVGSVVIRNWGMAAIVVAALPVSPVRAQQLLWTQDRPTTIDHYGSSVAFIRDWNGDGVADVVIGAYESTCAQPGDGDVEVRDGVAGVPLLLRWCGDQDASGATVVPVADVDGDGREDLVSAGPLFDDPTGGRDQGRIVLVSSATGAALWELIGESDLDNLGSVLVRLGDVTGDGYDEVLVSSPPQGSLGHGAAYVVSTVDASVVRAHYGTLFGEQLGYAICALDDVDGDGVADYAVNTILQLERLQGRIDLYSGATGVLLWTKTGDSLDGLGASMCNVGDWDGDGHGDLIAYVGKGDGMFRVYSPFTNQILIEASYSYLHDAGDYWGSSPTRLGDLDADGFIDFATGAYGDRNPIADTGRVDLYSGRTLRPLYHLYPQNFNRGWFGKALAGEHDLTGDGIPDLVVGAPLDRVSKPKGGKVFVYALNDLYLMAEPTAPLPGDTVVVDLRAGPPGLLGLVVLTDVSGTPLFEPLLVAPFDSNGELQICADVDASVSGLDFTLRGYSQNRAGRGPLMDSIDVTVSIQ